MKIAIVDGYVDEPSCLGVPPYISHYPRYAAGAAIFHGHQPLYITIDELRATGLIRGTGTLPAPGALERARAKVNDFLGCDLMVVLGGASVPGKYLRGMPMSLPEAAELSGIFQKTKMLGGPLARFSYSALGHLKDRYDYIARDDPDACLYDYLISTKWFDRNRINEEEDRWGKLGARIVSAHPDGKQVVAELNLYRGCVRFFTGGCLFCTDVLYGRPQFREPEGIFEEVGALSAAGVVNFRLGGASCLFCYRSEGVGRRQCPRPVPAEAEKLLSGIRAASPGLEVLHTDNANPAVIATYPDESRSILKSIVKHCTGGNVLSLGLESADPEVGHQNNLNATAEQTLTAIRLINEIGNRPSPTGLPALLPGINILGGLKGETEQTYDINFDFLRNVAASGLLLRRINIRQVLSVRHDFGQFRNKGAFRRFKEQVRAQIDHPMLQKILPAGTVLARVFPELTIGKLNFGRQSGTYPILVGMPAAKTLTGPMDVVIVNHGDRSVTGLRAPFKINKEPLSALSLIDGIGKKRAARLVTKRPFSGYAAAEAALDEPGLLKQYKDVLSYEK